MLRFSAGFTLLGLAALVILVIWVATRYYLFGHPTAIRLIDTVLLGIYIVLNARLLRFSRLLEIDWPLTWWERVLAAAAVVWQGALVAALLLPGGNAPDFWQASTAELLIKWFLVVSSLRLAFVLRSSYLLPGALHATPFSPAATVAGAFALVITSGTVLLLLPLAASSGAPIQPLDALFTATSATCVTGLIVLDTPGDFSDFGHLVIMLLMQIGGLGIMTFSVLFLAMMRGRVSLRDRLIVHNTLVTGQSGSVGRTIRDIITFVFVLEVCGALILALNWWTMGYSLPAAVKSGVFHAISAFNNAGFSLLSDSLERYAADPVTNLVIGGLILIGGLGFTVVVDLRRYVRERLAGRRPRLSLHSRLVLTTTAVLLAGAFVLLLAFETQGAFRTLGTAETLWVAGFQAVTPRTAGFNTFDITLLSDAGRFLLILLMFIGASPGSTGGGIKTSTFSVVLAQTLSVLRDQDTPHIWQRAIPESVRHRAFAVAQLFFMGIITFTMILCLTEKHDFGDLLFETVSAFGTVGLSLGVTAHLSALGRVVITVAMFVGRIGPLTLALAIRPPEKRPAIQYPDGDVMVG